MTGEIVSGFRYRCERLIRSLRIPEPFDVRTFLAGLALQRGRRIELIPATLPVTLACGMLVSTDDADYIFHATDTTPLHAQHIDIHEVGHLLLDHAIGVAGEPADNETLTLADQVAVRSLLPDLSPELIQRILGRTVYSDVHEREAELFASMLLARTEPSARPLRRTSDFATHLSQLRQPPARCIGGPWAA